MNSTTSKAVVIVGGGPAGLMAAEVLSNGGIRVDLYDAMPSVGRKFLLAGKGGLNLTHAEPFDRFLNRYGSGRIHLEPILNAFGPDALRNWAQQLSIKTFTGSSGRVFPAEMKSAPLLRAWLHHLRSNGVQFHARHRWYGWNANDELIFTAPEGKLAIKAGAVVLALGGGSWPQLGSDASWAQILSDRDIHINELQPSNCGFDVGWSEHLRNRYAGQPVKSVIIKFTDVRGSRIEHAGEFILTETGVEGSLIYAHSDLLRELIRHKGSAMIELDLAPDRSKAAILTELVKPRGSESISNHLRKRTGLKGIKAALLYEVLDKEEFRAPEKLAHTIKSLPLTLRATRPIAEAISTAGGIAFEELDKNLMLKKLPGVFCAGEMLDWDAPTGGYLLTACFASGYCAGHGTLKWLKP